MASLHCRNSVDAIEDMIEMGELLKTLGISGKGVPTLEAMKTRVKEHLGEDVNSNWIAGKAFKVFSNPKAEDIRMRAELNKLFMETDQVIHKLGDEIQEQLGDVRGKIKSFRQQLEVKEYVVLIAGETSAGKSSLLNLILGEEVLPYALLSTTSTICELKYGERRSMLVHYNNSDNRLPKSIMLEGKDLESIQRDIADFVRLKNEHRGKPLYKKVELFWPHPLLKEGVQIVDSPGIGESDDMDKIVAQYLPKAFAFIYVINSANAGGVQKDRIVKLLEQVQKMSCENQAGFSPKSALFVFNKWDVVPKKEVEEVKSETIQKLSTLWPGLDVDTQVVRFSTERAALAQRYGITSKEFTALLNSIKALVTRSMESRLEVHSRWLNELIKRMIMHAMAFLENADRDRDDTMRQMRSVNERLNRLEKDQEKIIAGLEVLLKRKTTDAKGKMAEYIRSDGFREKFCAWSHDDGPSADPESWEMTECWIQESLQRRFKDLIEEWEQEHHIFTNARLSLIQQFLSKFKAFEKQLEFLKGDVVVINASDVTSRPAPEELSCFDDEDLIFQSTLIPGVIFFPLNLVSAMLLGPGVALSEKADKHIFWATSILWGPLAFVGGILALPTVATTVAIVSARKKVKEVKMRSKIKKYEANRVPFLQESSSTFLSNILDHEEALSKYAEYLMKDAELCLEQVKAGIPNLIMMDRRLYQQLEGEKRSKEEIKRIYDPLKEDCEHLRYNLKKLFEATW